MCYTVKKTTSIKATHQQTGNKFNSCSQFFAVLLKWFNSWRPLLGTITLLVKLALKNKEMATVAIPSSQRSGSHHVALTTSNGPLHTNKPAGSQPISIKTSSLAFCPVTFLWSDHIDRLIPIDRDKSFTVVFMSAWEGKGMNKLLPEFLNELQLLQRIHKQVYRRKECESHRTDANTYKSNAAERCARQLTSRSYGLTF